MQVLMPETLEAAESASGGSPWPSCTVLADVTCFLRRMDLEYFKGMTQAAELPLLDAGLGAFYTA